MVVDMAEKQHCPLVVPQKVCGRCNKILRQISRKTATNIARAYTYVEPRREPTERELRDEQDGFYQNSPDAKEAVIAGLAVHILTHPHGLSDEKTEELLNAVMWCRRGYELVPLLRPLRERKAK